MARARDYQGLADDVRRTLGADDALAASCARPARVPRRVPDARRPRHARLLRLLAAPLRLAEGHLPDGHTTVRDIARNLYGHLTNLGEVSLGQLPPREVDGRRWSRDAASASASYFGDDAVHVML